MQVLLGEKLLFAGENKFNHRHNAITMGRGGGDGRGEAAAPHLTVEGVAGGGSARGILPAGGGGWWDRRTPVKNTVPRAKRRSRASAGRRFASLAWESTQTTLVRIGPRFPTFRCGRDSSFGRGVTADVLQSTPSTLKGETLLGLPWQHHVFISYDNGRVQKRHVMNSLRIARTEKRSLSKNRRLCSFRNVISSSA